MNAPERLWIDGKPLRDPNSPNAARWHAGATPIVKTEVEYVRADLVRALIEATMAGIYAETKHTDAADLNICDKLLEAWHASNQLSLKISAKAEAAS